MKKILFLLLFLSVSTCYAGANASLGVFKNFDKVQDQDGEETRDPYHPMVQVGYNFSPYWGLIFSPQFFYATTTRQSNDDYGGDYSVTTYGILYDFLYPFNGGSMAFRFGIGNVIKSISGEGGTVEVPNGTGTSTAYKPPAESSKSYTGTLNLGFEAVFAAPTILSGIMTHTGLRAEYLISSPLKSDKRAGYFTFSLQGYF